MVGCILGFISFWRTGIFAADLWKTIRRKRLEIGIPFSDFPLVPALIRPFLGWALDRWGKRPFLLFGLSGYLLATLVFAYLTAALICSFLPSRMGKIADR